MNELSAIYQLMTWFSSSYPIGSFNFSHGIESAVECGLIKNSESLAEWVSGIIQFGTGRMDLIMFKLAYELFYTPNLISSNFIKKLKHLVSLSNALKLSPELWQESIRQGDAALKALLNTCPSESLHFFNNYLKDANKSPVIALVFGIACAEQKIPLKWALTAYLHAFALNLVTAGIKLIPLGQTAGQSILAALKTVIQESVNLAIKAKISDIGSATPMVEWTSIQHENQYTRLFQS